MPLFSKSEPPSEPEIVGRVSMDKEIARYLEPLGTTFEEWFGYWRRGIDAEFGEFRKDPRLERAEDIMVTRYNLAEACRLKGREDLALQLHAANVRDQVPAQASYRKLITACHKAGDIAGEVAAIEAILAWADAQSRFLYTPQGEVEASASIVWRAKMEARLAKARAKLEATGA